jgi:hypothetical protein
VAKYGEKRKGKKADEGDAILVAKHKKVIDRIFNDTSTHREQMTRYLKEYRGEWWNDREVTDANNDSKVFVNYVFSTTMSIAPLLTDNRPTWRVNARKPYMERMAEIYNACLEYLWDKLEMDRNVFRWVVNALVMKKGYLQVSFDPGEDEIRVDVIDPRTFFIAPGYADLWDAPYCGTRTTRPLSWIRKHYPDKAELVKIESFSETDSQEPFVDTSDREEWQLHSDQATVYTLWMEDGAEKEFEDPETGEKTTEKMYPNGKFMVFTQSVLLEEKPSIYEHAKPPFVDLDDYIDPVDFMGMGEADQIEQLNRSYNRGLQLIDKFVTLYCDPNWIADDSAGVDIKDIKKNLPGGGNIFDYNGLSNANPIQRLEMGELPQTLFQFMTATPQIIEEVSGVTEISKGMATKTERQTAAEISTLIESSYTRTRQRVRNFEHSLKRVGWLMVELMQQFYTEERTIPHNADDENGKGTGYARASSSPEFVDQVMRPRANPEDPKQQAEYAQEQKDYEAYLKFIEEFGEVDSVHADFDIVIDSNSTLPMDKQSLANLMLRLAQMKIVDPRAVLEQLKPTNYKQIIKRMEEQARAAMQPQGPAGQNGQKPPRMPGPQNQAPQDMQDLVSANARPEGV